MLITNKAILIITESIKRTDIIPNDKTIVYKPDKSINLECTNIEKSLSQRMILQLIMPPHIFQSEE